MDLNRLRKLAGLNEAITPDDIEKIMFGNLKRAPEGDTEVEADLYDKIEDFIKSATPKSKGTASTVLQDLQALKAHYPDDLIPTAKFAYRGIQLDQGEYDKLALSLEKRRRGWIKLPFTYNARSNIQSWTTSKNIAMLFATAGAEYGYDESPQPKFLYSRSLPFPAILQTAVDDSFILSNKISGKIASQIYGISEEEIIRISNSPIQSTALVHTSWIAAWIRYKSVK